MPRRRFAVTGIVLCLLFVVCPTTAATSKIEVDDTVTVPDVVANKLIADGEGDDWIGAVLRVDLTAGSVYNAPGTDPGNLGPWLGWPWPLPEGDTYVGIVNDGSAGIAGGAGDLDCVGQSLSGTGVCAVSVTWFNTAVGDTSSVQIGNISLSDDAAGTWEMFTGFANGNLRTSGPVINGVMVPEPGALALLLVGGVALLRRDSGLTGFMCREMEHV